MSCVLNTRVKIKTIAWLVGFFLVIFSPLNGFSQSQGLEKFLKDKEATARKTETEINEFVRSNQTPLSFNTEEGTHFSLVEIRKGRPIYRMTLNAEAITTTNVSGLRSSAGLGFNLQGSGMLVGIFDDGLVKDHIELDSRVVSKEGTQEMNHATHVTGTIIATGINPAAQGMAPKAKATTFYFGNDEVKMAALAGLDQNSLLFSNHSYGEATGWSKSNNVWNWTGDPSVASDEDFRFGFYGERARSLDELAHLAPYYSIVWAAGNDRADVGNGSRLPDCNGGTGYDCIIPDAVAKNIITVGAVNKVSNYINPSNVQMSFFSSWGPTDDGRIKPDVVGAGVNLFSLSSSGTNSYSTLSGTSMATPNVTGSLLLLQELYSRLHGGNFMRAATLKALVIHTTREAGNFPGPDYSYGWGLVNATAAAQLLRDQDNQQQIVGEYKLVSGQPFELELDSKANQKITATIVWTDPAAKPVDDALDPSNLMLVNDLDVRIVDAQGIQQFPWKLDPLNPAMKASRGDNFRDNVEKIEFDSPLQKKYKLQVSNKGQLVGDQQEFSLIVTYKTTNTTPKTYYWIGDSGNWTDVNHWSLTSGGLSAQAIPVREDKVIVDENSFDGIGEDVISVTEDVSISSLLWLTNKVNGIGFNDKKITIARQLILGFDSFLSIGNGNFHVKNNGNETGEISIKKAILPGITLTVEGKWNLSGEVDLDELNMISGSLAARNTKMTLKRLNASGALTKELVIIRAQISIKESSNLNGTNLTLQSDSTTVVQTDNTSLNWNGIDFKGHLISASGTTKIIGANHFSKVTIKNDSEWNGTNAIEELDANPGSKLLLVDGTELSLTSKAKLTGILSQPISIVSNSNASVRFSDHYKYCYDFLKVTNVDVKSGTVNAGLNSTVTSSDNWQQKKCEDVLFADFKINSGCAGAIAEFMDTSVGSPDKWLWNFGNNAVSSTKNSSFKFEKAGAYPVSLTVSKAGNSQTYTTNVTIKENTIAENTIAVNNETMTSFLIADRYQWMKDGATLSGANQRSYAYNGEGGIYSVVVYDDQCNASSDIVTITGAGKEINLEISIYPNPVSERLVISSSGEEIQCVEMIDLIGRTVYSQHPGSNLVQIEVDDLLPSIYFIKILTANQEIRKRIVKR